jgi:aerobic C4-dicarboxylate transport protein
VATLVVAKWVGDLDMERLHAELDNESPQAANEPEKILDQTNTKLGA